MLFRKAKATQFQLPLVNTTFTDREKPNERERLHFFHELDEWQQDNHYIRSGYVRETSSLRKCLSSLTYIHNESGNIYSHLIPSILVSFVVANFLNYELKDYENELGLWERLNFVQFGISATTCLILSSGFHLFKCHSQTVCRFGNQCDYFGIIIMITCSLISIILFVFHDIPYWKNSFIILFVILGSLCTKVTFDRKFSSPAYRPYRSLMFILFGLSGIMPVATAICLFGFQDAIERSNAKWLVAEGLFYISGTCLYAMRIPERFAYDELAYKHNVSGRFDIWGHSHQIFHVAVVVAAYCHWKALTGCCDYLHTRTLQT